MTGFYRDGYCNTGPQDQGSHTVCAQLNDAFLDFTVARGNDLRTPHPEFNFPGLKAGDRWCLCASRWKEAKDAGYPCPIVLASTHRKALEIISLEELQEHASE